MEVPKSVALGIRELIYPGKRKERGAFRLQWVENRSGMGALMEVQHAKGGWTKSAECDSVLGRRCRVSELKRVACRFIHCACCANPTFSPNH
jgi:hypothetical protein